MSCYDQTIDTKKAHDLCGAVAARRLGVARAAAMSSDPEHARTSHERFMMLWRETDSGLQPMNDAREELARLKATSLR